ncbi:MAG: HEPN domain-containing protein [Chloroflexi bacterium]|nr:HEPN domain-containing protein [Chloroflexota bacterium]
MKNSEADGRRWLSQAENDLGAAQLMAERAFYAQACFMCHQVAEKALKALAYYRGDRYVLGHSLLELLREIVGTFPEMSQFESLMGVLNQYYVPTRYPDALPGGTPFETYNQGQAEEAVRGASRLVDAAKGLIPN